MVRLSNNTALNALGFGLGSTFPPIAVLKTVTFIGTGNGAVGTGVIANVTGTVEVVAVPICGTTLVGTGTIGLGTPTLGTGLLAATTVTNIVKNSIWQSTTPTVVPNVTTFNKFVVSENILTTIATAPVTAGTINFYFFYRPLSIGASIS